MIDSYTQKRLDAFLKKGFKIVGCKDLGDGEKRFFLEKEFNKDTCNGCIHYYKSKVGKKNTHYCRDSEIRSFEESDLLDACCISIIKREVNDFNKFKFNGGGIYNSRSEKLDYTLRCIKFPSDKSKKIEIKSMIKDFTKVMNDTWRDNL